MDPSTPLAGDSTQLSYTQKRTVKRILIRCGSHGYFANFHAVRLCSHVRFCVRDGHVRLLPGVLVTSHIQNGTANTLTAVGFTYLRITLTYWYIKGSRLTSLLPVVPSPTPRPSGSFLRPLSWVGSYFSIVENGFGIFRLFSSGFPVIDFCLPKTGDDALQSSVQLVRKMIWQPLFGDFIFKLEIERISWSKISISNIGFVFGLVGLLRKPSCWAGMSGRGAKHHQVPCRGGPKATQLYLL